MKNPRPKTGEVRGAAPSAEAVVAEERRDEPVVVVTNSGKGGAGKTALGHAVVHTALRLGKKPVILDFDQANPDLWAGWPEVDGSDRYALRTNSFEGWEDVIGTIRALDGSYVVVLDLPANSSEVTDRYLSPMMKSGGYHVTMWALDPGAKPLDALLKYGAGSTLEPIVVARSIFKADRGDADFEMWKRFGSSVDLRDGFVFDVPNLESAVRVAMVEGGDDVTVIGDLGKDRGGWSIDRIAADEKRFLRASRAKDWLTTMRPQIERAMASARRVAP